MDDLYKKSVITVITVLITTFLAFAIVMIIIGKAGKGKNPQFDERQKLIRATAGKHAFWVMLICSIVYGLTVYLAGKSFLNDGVSGIIISIIGITVFNVEAVCRDAYFNLKLKAVGSTIVTTLLLSVCLIYHSVRIIRTVDIFNDGIVTIAILPIVVSVSQVVLALTMIVKYLIVKKRGQKE